MSADGSPAATSDETVSQLADRHYVWPLMAKKQLARERPIIFREGRGAILTDVRGHSYIDLMSSFTRASALGYGSAEIAEAVSEQLVRLHYAGTVAYQADTTIQLSAKLAELAPGSLSATVFVSSGSEANEVAYKLARFYHHARGSKPRAYKIITRWDEYHGATGAAAAASDWLGVRGPAEPSIVPGFSRIPCPTSYRPSLGLDLNDYNRLCVDYLEQEILRQGPDLVAAFLAEPIAQSNGAQPPPSDYFPRIREICDRYDVLLLIDEVVTGFGRTGEWFAVNHWNLIPDILIVAKALTAGYAPLGAAIVRQELWDVLPGFPDVHTWNGHPAAAAAALAAISIYEREDLIERSRNLGDYTLAFLRDLECLEIVGQTRGLGMWLAVDLTANKETREPLPHEVIRQIVLRARERGVLVGQNGTAIELAPPLNIERTVLDEGLTRFQSALAEVSRDWVTGAIRTEEAELSSENVVSQGLAIG